MQVEDTHLNFKSELTETGSVDVVTGVHAPPGVENGSSCR
jgi:hypothetical protein